MSFMKKVAKIAAPFASFIPGVGPLISAGLGVVGSLGGGGKKNGAMDGMNSQLMQQLLSGVTAQQGMSKGAFDKGNSLVDTGLGTMGKGTDYFSNILGGKADTALAGPISDLTRGYSTSLQNTANFAPRGGMAAGQMAQRGGQLAGQIARLKTDSLNGAANSLLGAGSSQLGAGANILGTGLQGYQNTLSTLLGARGQDISQLIAKMQIDAQNSQGLGQGIGSLLGTLLGPGGILSGRSTSSGGSIFGGGGGLGKGGGMAGTGGKA